MLLFLVLFSGCSSGKTSSLKPVSSEVHRVGAMVISTLHFRRPLVPSADPQAGPGGEDYQSHPPPDSRLDCQPQSQLFAGRDLKAIGDCINHIRSPISLVYELHRTAVPVLSLKDPEDTAIAACVRELLREIPVPREIFFQGKSVEGEFGCYASGISPEDDRWWKLNWLTRHARLTVELPRAKALADSRETELQMLTWALAPFRSAATGVMSSRVVPETLCRTCIGDENLIHSPQIALPLWPPAED